MPRIIQRGQIQAIRAGALVTITVYKSVGIAIGIDGISTNDPRLQISCNAAAGPVLPVSIRRSPDIGYFSEKHVQFSSPDGLVPAQPVSLLVRFTSIKEIEVGEHVVLALPGFTRDVGYSSIPHNNEHFEELTWDPIEETLQFLVKNVVRKNFRQEFLIERHIGKIRLPVDGIVRDSPYLTLSTDAKAGPVEKLPIVSNPPVGALLDLALAYDPPMASAITSIIFRFRPSMSLEEYDAIELHLPSFTGPEFGVIESHQIKDLNSPHGAMLFHGVWSNTKPDRMLVLMVDCGKSVPANQSFHLVISSTAGIRMPAQAIRLNQQDFRISSSAKIAPVATQRISSVLSVGAFMNNDGEGVTVTYLVDDSSGKPGPGEFVNIKIAFEVDMDILSDEVIQIFLPGFGIENTTTSETCEERRSTVNGGVGNFFTRGSWNLTSQMLYLTTAVPLVKDQLVELIVPNSFGLRLPLNGLELDHSTLQMGGVFVSGNVAMTPIYQSPQVAVLKDFTFVMEPPMVAEDVALSFSFRHVADLRIFEPGETIRIFLPGFSSHPNDASFNLYSAIQKTGQSPLNYSQIIASPAIFASAHWDGISDQLVLTVGVQIRFQNDIQIFIPKLERFRLPLTGIPTDFATFLLDQQIGPSLPSRVRNGAVGYFGSNARVLLVFTKMAPLLAGEVITMQIEFEPTMRIESGESTVFVLPGFERASSFVPNVLCGFEAMTICSEDVDSEYNFDYTWRSGELTVTVPSGHRLEKNSRVQLYIKHTAGILLPEFGVRKEQSAHGVTVRSDAIAGKVLTTAITCEPPVGSFKQTSVTFGNEAQPGQHVSLNLTLVPYMQLDPGDSVTILLPGFKGPNFTPGTNEIRPGFAVSHQNFIPLGGTVSDKVTVYWQAASETLVLRFLQSIAGAEFVSIFIPKAGRLRPKESFGLKRDDLVQIQAQVQDGPVDATQFETVQEIGIFTTFELDFLPATSVLLTTQQPAERRPGQLSSMEIRLEYSWEIFQGDSIYIILPEEFRRHGDEDIILSRSMDLTDTRNLSETPLEAAYQFKARWSAMYNEIELTCENCKTYSYGCICGSSKVGGAASVAIIRDGFFLPEGLAQSDSRIQIYAIDSRDLMMNFHQPVGFSPKIGLNDSHIQFEPRKPGESTQITLAFEMTMSLQINETIAINMLGFIAIDGDVDVAGVIVDQSTTFGNKARWKNSTLILSLASQIPAYTQIRIHVSRDASGGIRLPIFGISAHDSGVIISVDCQAGKFRLPIQNVQTVFGFQHSSIKLYVNSTQGIVCSFRASTALGSGQKLEVFVAELQLSGTKEGIAFSTEPAGLVRTAFLRTTKDASGNFTYVVMELLEAIAAETSFSIRVSGFSIFYTGSDVDSLQPEVSLVGQSKFLPFISKLLDVQSSRSLSRPANIGIEDMFGRNFQSTTEGSEKFSEQENANNTGIESEDRQFRNDLARSRLYAAQGRLTVGASFGLPDRVRDLADDAEPGILVERQERRQGVASSFGCQQLTSRSVLKYIDSRAAEVVSFQVSFTCLQPGVSDFSLVLPHLSRPSAAIDMGLRYFGRWTEEDKLLIIYARFDLNDICLLGPCNHTFVVPAAARFILNSRGVVANDPAILFEFDFSDDVVCRESVEKSDAIGSFYDSSGVSSGPRIEFLPGIPGKINEVFIKLKTQGIITPGEIITINLPGFTGISTANITISLGSCRGDPVLFLAGSGSDSEESENGGGYEKNRSLLELGNEDLAVFATASWSVSTSLLELTVRQSIKSLQLCSLTVPFAANVQLPETGVLPNIESKITIALDSAMGSILPTRVFSVKGVGSLSNHSLEYIPSAVKETQIRIRFKPSMPMIPGDRLIVRLPNFLGESSTCVRIGFYKSEPRGSIALGDWDRSSEELILYITGNIIAFESVMVLVPASAGLILPMQGLKTNQASLTMEAQALYGNVPADPISVSEPVGSFLMSPNLTFAPGIAGKQSALKLSFEPQMNLQSGETLSIVLTGFTGVAQEFTPLSVPSGLFSNASFLYLLPADSDQQESQQEIRFVVNHTIRAGTQVTINVPMDAGIIIPLRGLKENQQSLKLRTDAIAGPVRGVSITSSDPVGAFFDASTLDANNDSPSPRISFRFDDANGPAQIRFEFIATMPIVSGESITLKLPSFSAGVDIGAVPLLENGNRFDVKWTESTQELNVIFRIALASDTSLSFNISSTAGIRLPPFGVRLNDEDLQIKCNAISGPVLWIPIKYSQAVGVFEQTHVELGPPLANATASLLLNFSFNRPISPGEEVILTLTGRESVVGDACDPFQINAGSHNITTASENASFDRVEVQLYPVLKTLLAIHPNYFVPKWLQRPNMIIFRFVARSRVETATNISLIVSGVRVPSCGLPTNNAISLSTNAREGPVQPVSLSTIGIGAFRNTSLVFEPPRIASITEITVGFRATMNLNVGARVTLHLPGFTGKTSTNFMVSSSSACCQTLPCFSVASWDNTTSLLHLHVTKSSKPVKPDVDRFCFFQVQVPALLRLPPDGVKENDTRLTIFTDATDGRVEPVAVQDSTGVYTVGSLDNSSKELNSSIEFVAPSRERAQPAAGLPAVLRIMIRAMMVFSVGDTVTLYLPAFVGEQLASSSACRECDIQEALWNANSSTLVLTFARAVQARQTVVYETQEHFLSLPLDGVRKDQDTITISSTAAAGPFSETRLASVLPVGSFLNNTVLEFGIRPMAAPILPYTNDICCPAERLQLVGERIDVKTEDCCLDTNAPSSQSDITLSFKSVMNLDAGDRLELRLCNFTAGPVPWDMSNRSIDVSPSERFTATWNQVDRLLRIILLQNSTGGEWLSVTVLGTQNDPLMRLQLPPNGIYANTDCLQISTNSRNGPVPFTTISSVPPVGAFWNSSIEFTGARPGSVNAWILRFTPKMPLTKGFEIILKLNGFSGADLSCESATSEPPAFGATRWERQQSQVIIEIIEDVDAGTPVAIMVPSSSIIRLPLRGIDSSTMIRIGTDTPLGPVLLTRVLQIPRVGLQGTFGLTEIHLGDVPRRFTNVPFNFTFIYNQDLNVHDVITILLPGFLFTGLNDETFLVSSSRVERDLTCWEKKGIPCWQTRSEIQGNYINKGSWHSAEYTAMLLTVTQVISAGQQISAVISAGYGIQVPKTGLLKNSVDIVAKCTASAGSSDFQIVQTSPGVGGFINLGLDFDPRKVEELSTVTVNFQPIMIMTPQEPADSVIIWLPYFTGTNDLSIDIPAPFQNASWKDDLCRMMDIKEDCLEPSASESYCQWELNDRPWCKQKVLRGASGVEIKVSENLSVLQTIKIVLSSSLAIHMPSNALAANQASLRVGGRVKGLSVASVPFFNSFAVGALYDAKYSFDPVFADQPTRLTVTFRTGMMIRQDETVTLHLPNFNSVGNWRVRLAASVSSRFQFASWNQVTQELVLTCFINLNKGAQVTETVSVSSIFGLRLPAEGITFDSTDLAISSNAIDGPVLTTIVTKFDTIGALLNTRIDFGKPRVGGARVTMRVSFTAMLDLDQSKQGSTCSTVDRLLIMKLARFTLGPGDKLYPYLNALSPVPCGFRWPGVDELYSGGEPMPASQLLWGDTPVTQSATFFTVSSTVNPITQGFWSGNRDTWKEGYVEANQLVVFIDANIPIFTEISFSIGHSANLRLPTQDLIANGNRGNLTIQTAQSLASVPATPIRRSPGVLLIGLLSASKLIYFSATGVAANKAAGLIFVFTPRMNIYPEDTLILHLPDFNCGDETTRVRITHVDAKFATNHTAAWNQALNQLVITFDQELPGDIESRVEILEEAGMKLPVKGLTVNQAKIQATFIAIAGNMAASPILVSKAIGSVMNTSRLEFDSAVHGSITGMTLQFVPQMDIAQGEIIKLSLPLFRSNSFSFKTSGFDGRWENSTHQIVLSTNTTFPSGHAVSLVVPRGIQVPDTGVRLDDAAITLEIQARSGPMIPTSVFSTESIGSMTNTTAWVFDPPQVQVDCNLNFSFVPEMDLVAGDNITLKLPRFSRSAVLEEHACTKVVTDAYGIEHCVGVWICISPTCSLDIVSSSQPAHTLQALSFHGRLSQVSSRSIVLSGNRTVQRLGMDKQQISVNETFYFNQTMDVYHLVDAFELIVVVIGHVPRGLPTSIIVDAVSTFQLPPDGIVSDDSAFQVRVSASRGNVPLEPVIQVPGVGAFLTSILRFDNPRAGMVSNITLTFVVTTPLLPGDVVFVKLDSFTGSDLLDFQVRSTSYDLSSSQKLSTDIIASARWALSDQLLELFIAKEVAAETSVQINIPSTANIAIPNTGLSPNQKTLVIYLTGFLGEILPTPIANTMSIGAFDEMTLEFLGPATAGHVVSLRLSVLANMQLSEFDSICFALPQFKRGAATTNEFTHTMDGIVEHGTLLIEWFQETATLCLYLRSSYISGKSLAVNFTTTFGFIVPLVGVRQNEKSFTVRSNATLGQVIPTSLMTVQPIGFFHKADIIFEPALVTTSRSNHSYEFSISIHPAMGLYDNETVQISLKGFKAPSGPLVFTASVIQSVVWDQMQHVLTLKMGRNIEKDFDFDVVIPPQGFKLPATGVFAGSIQILTDAKAGPVLPVNMKFVPIGSFTTTSTLGFSVLRAGELTDILVQFRATMPFNRRETVSIGLPGFSGPRMDFELNNVLPEGAFRRASWSSANQVLEMTVANFIPANVSVSMNVLKSKTNLRLPEQGIRTLDPAMAIATNARAGLVLETPIWNLPSIGYFSSSNISFNPAMAGEVNNISISFTTQMSVQFGEIIFIGLPGFMYNISDNLARDVTTSAEDSVHFAWNSSSGELAIEANKVIPSGHTFHLELSKFLMPLGGVKSNVLTCSNLQSPYAYGYQCLTGMHTSCECEE